MVWLVRKVREESNRFSKFIRKGTGETLIFICISPLFLVVIIALVSFVQSASTRERLEYTTYVACRAAAISSSFEEAEKKAKEAAQMDFDISYNELSGDVQTVLSVIEDKDKQTPEAKNDYSADDDDDIWSKGNYVKCTVTVTTDTLMGLKSEKKCTLVMAIEKPETMEDKDEKKT